MNSTRKSDELNHLLNTIPTSSDAQRKARAKSMALQAFNAQQAQLNKAPRQGFFIRLRQTIHQLLIASDKMTQRWIYSGGIAAVFLVGLSLFVFQSSEQILEQTLEQESHSSSINSDVGEVDQPLAVQNSVIEAEEIVITSPTETFASTPQMQQDARAQSELRLRQFSDAPKSLSKARGITDSDQLSVEPVKREHRDRFQTIDLNTVKKVIDEPISTFSIDVDTSSYSYVRSQLNGGVLPKKSAVRLEELVNYFDYQYPVARSKNVPFQPTVSVFDSPWKKGNKLIHIGIKGYEISPEKIPKSNLVFLLDVSGSMNQANKLPLVKQSFELMLSQLRENDTVAIVVYAGQSGVVLEPTAVKEKTKILTAIKNLRPSGSTAGAAGIQTAYELAESQFEKGAVNRVILATDGDFNVGVSNIEELKGLIERKRKTGVFLSVLGFGQGNYHDQLMQELAQNGNGIAAYIDTLSEAQKVLVEQSNSLLFPIANDVKIQVEFNPSTVSEYRLLGYETRALAQQDFKNDQVDAGEIGAGHSVTAIYEVTLVGTQTELFPKRRYGQDTVGVDPANPSSNSELGYLKVRYKQPGSDVSKLIETPIFIHPETVDTVVPEAQFSIAVAGFAQLLVDSEYVTEFTYDDVITMAQANKGDDFYGYRSEFIQLVRKAKIAKDIQ